VSLGPVDGRETHRTRLATGVQIAIIETEGLKPATRIANGDDFGVRSGIVGRGDLIAAAPYYAVPFHNDRAKRAAFAAAHHVNREPDRRAHEFFVHGNKVAMFVEHGICFPPSKTFSTWPCDHLRSR